MAKLLISVFSFRYLKPFSPYIRHPKPRHFSIGRTEVFPVCSELWCTCPANFYFTEYGVFSISCDNLSLCFHVALSSTCISKWEQVNPRTSQGKFLQVVQLGWKTAVRSWDLRRSWDEYWDWRFLGLPGPVAADGGTLIMGCGRIWTTLRLSTFNKGRAGNIVEKAFWVTIYGQLIFRTDGVF